MNSTTDAPEQQKGTREPIRVGVEGKSY